MPLPSLPIDVLLVILRDLEIVDVICTGMTCKDLYQAIQEHHVWIDQFEKLCQKDPALRSAIPPLTSLSTQELKTFVTRRAKLHLRWGKDKGENGFVTKGLVEVSGIRMLWLLPGGKSMIIVDDRGGVTLRRVELDGGRASLPTVADVKYGQVEVLPGFEWFKLLTAMSPCPIIVHNQGKIVYLIKIDHHSGLLSLETTFPIPEGCAFLRAHGQGRVVGFLIQEWLGPLRAVIIHLDHPGFTMECEVPPTHTVGGDLTFNQWSTCVPTESLAIIYNTQHILVYEIPNFSTLSRNTNLSRGTPMWNWPGPDRVDEKVRLYLIYMNGEALHDPPSAREFNLHFICEERLVQTDLSTFIEKGPFATTVTIPINTGRNPSSKSTEPPAPKYRVTRLQNHVGESFGFSCQKGLHLDRGLQGEEFEILVTPLDDLVSEGGRGTLRVLLSNEGLDSDLSRCGVDMDDASGRVIIWGWDEDEDRDKFLSKVLIGDMI